jgi:hypothetical protein
MGYVEVSTTPDCNIFPPGCTARGHVFHYSEIVEERAVGAGLAGTVAAASGRGGGKGEGDSDPPDGVSSAAAPWRAGYAARLQTPGAAAEVPEGFCCQHVLASYVHLHFGSAPALAAALVAACREVDVEGANAAAAEAAAVASAPMHATPPRSGSRGGGSGILTSRSTPDLGPAAAASADPDRRSSRRRSRTGSMDGAQTRSFGGHFEGGSSNGSGSESSSVGPAVAAGRYSVAQLDLAPVRGGHGGGGLGGAMRVPSHSHLNGMHQGPGPAGGITSPATTLTNVHSAGSFSNHSVHFNPAHTGGLRGGAGCGGTVMMPRQCAGCAAFAAYVSVYSDCHPPLVYCSSPPQSLNHPAAYPMPVPRTQIRMPCSIMALSPHSLSLPSSSHHAPRQTHTAPRPSDTSNQPTMPTHTTSHT